MSKHIVTLNRNEKDYMVKFNNGQEDLSIAFNVCDFARREPADGKRDYANLLSGGEIQGDYKHLTSDLIEDVKVELLGNSPSNLQTPNDPTSASS
jgi:hypothetical protein